MDKDPTSSGVRTDADGASTLDLSGRCVGSSYILIRPIGQGATGTVWRGVDRASGEPVAVKLLHESLLRQPKLVTRFVQERTILLMLRHRNVVRVRDLFSVGETLGLVMDLVPGGSLREHLREHHTVAAAEAARLAAQVAAALAEAHELGVVHRDLKPDNILLHHEDGRLDTRLTDFGIARVLNTPALTTPNAVVGTPHYMSPEAFHGAAASPAADVYALGVLLYEIVAGRPPYQAETVPDLMRLHLAGDPERLPGIPDPLWAVITSCLAQKPRLRPTAAELVAELSDVARAVAGTPALPRPSPSAAHPGSAAPQPGSDGPQPGSAAARPGPAAQPGSGAEPESAARPRPESRPGAGADPGAGAAGPSAEDEAGRGEPGRAEHPSLIVPAPRLPQRRNQAPSWRWARPTGLFTVLAGTMLASGVATTAWHLGRSDAEPRQITAAATPAVTPSGAPAPAASSPTAGRPAGTGTAAGRQVRDDTPDRPATAPARARTVPATTAPARKAPMPEARPYGPQECAQVVKLDMNDPVVAETCHAVGAGVQLSGSLRAQGGARATTTLSLLENGRTVGGPYTCQLTFGGDGSREVCGPKTVAARKGHRYAVRLTWQYQRNGRILTGSTVSDGFTF